MICKWCRKPIRYIDTYRAGGMAAVWHAGDEGNGFYCAKRANTGGQEWHQPSWPDFSNPDHVAAWLDDRPYRPKRTGFAIAA